MTSDELFEKIPDFICMDGKRYHLKITKHFSIYTYGRLQDYILFDGCNCINGTGLNDILKKTMKKLKSCGYVNEKGELYPQFKDYIPKND